MEKKANKCNQHLVWKIRCCDNKKQFFKLKSSTQSYGDSKDSRKEKQSLQKSL